MNEPLRNIVGFCHLLLRVPANRFALLHRMGNKSSSATPGSNAAAPAAANAPASNASNSKKNNASKNNKSVTTAPVPVPEQEANAMKGGRRSKKRKQTQKRHRRA